jgi:uroporphyrinogen III methyltransferase/synthase
MPAENFTKLIQGITIASIGPITSDTAKKLGFNVHITAESYTIPGLVEAILQYYHKG